MHRLAIMLQTTDRQTDDRQTQRTNAALQHKRDC